MLYHSESGIEIYLGDCREILPTLRRFDLLLTDPPYGIDRANGMGGQGFDGFGKQVRRAPREYVGEWDKAAPSTETLSRFIELAGTSIVWGGNYLSLNLPASQKWLVWIKCQTMPSFSDAEIAWTNLDGVSTKMFRLNGSGLMAVEQDRWHPTQKPLALMKWCLSLVPLAQTVFDPFAGSGTTGVACKAMGIQCTMIEREEKYAEIAANRLRQGVFAF